MHTARRREKPLRLQRDELVMLVRIAMTEGMQSELSFVSLLFPQDNDVLKAPNSTPEFDTSCNMSYRLEPSLNYS